MTALADLLVAANTFVDASARGRRLRIFARCMTRRADEIVFSFQVSQPPPMTLCYPEPVTYGELMLLFEDEPRFARERDVLDRLQLSVRHTHDLEVIHLLTDLANEFNKDLHDACAALDDAQLYYPGVDPPLIEPVPDEHVHTVIAALQRELDRETRPGPYGKSLPPVPLKQLPWHVQRALVERRRLRFAEWDIGRKEYEMGFWSLWRVQEDPEWIPR